MVGKMVTIRVQGREGIKRIELNQKETTYTLYQKTQESFGYDSGHFTLHKDRQKKVGILPSRTVLLNQFGISHGDLLFLTPEPGVTLNSSQVTPTATNSFNDATPSTSSAVNNTHGSSSSISSKKVAPVVVEDDVDVQLSSQTGLIERGKDEKMCQHDSNGRCLFCAPLEPYDESYLLTQNIKHLSFHSHLRKLTSGADKGKFVALEDLNVDIKKGCQSHLPWPAGICSKCQPSAVTLNRQLYRHVDNVMFENPHIVERFIAYWRNSGCQRIGFLYGNYEQHVDVPLGIRARVAAIYEPLQDGRRDFVNLNQTDRKLPIVNEVAKALGFKCVGWVFTDLLPEDTTKGTVKHLRGIDTFFLSAQECVTAANFQNIHPNPCKLAASSGTFGSKFATVLITGDDKNQVHMVGYQVSNQCMSLVRGNCLLTTKDAPELGFIKESSDKQYVPDVYYKEKDEYGNEVTRLGRPLPVEYLLVDVPVSTPKEPKFTFPVKVGIYPFPIANREAIGQIQDFAGLANYLGQFPKNTPFLEVASDFHFLIYIATMDIVPICDYIGPLLQAIREGDAEKANDWARSEHWATVEQLIAASMIANPPSRASDGSSNSENMATSPGPSVMSPQSTWTCPQCTFINNGTSPICEVCQIHR